MDKDTIRQIAIEAAKQSLLDTELDDVWRVEDAEHLSLEDVRRVLIEVHNISEELSDERN